MKPVTPLCQEVRGAQPLITASLSAWRPIIFILSYLMGCLQAVKATQPQLNTQKHNRTLSFYGPFIGELWGGHLLLYNNEETEPLSKIIIK